jgi:hypothetical protein
MTLIIVDGNKIKINYSLYATRIIKHKKPVIRHVLQYG